MVHEVDVSVAAYCNDLVSYRAVSLHISCLIPSFYFQFLCFFVGSPILFWKHLAMQRHSETTTQGRKLMVPGFLLHILLHRNFFWI